MNNRITLLFLLLSVCIGLYSCKKDIVDNPNNTEYSTDVEQFEAVWNGLNTSYVMWTIDSTDWDAVYEKYHPIFKDMEGRPDEMWVSAWRDLTSTCGVMFSSAFFQISRPVISSSGSFFLTISRAV